MSIAARIERFAAPWVRNLVPYDVEDAAGLTKLDAMENPYPLPENLRKRWMDVVEGVNLNRYPDPRATELRRKLLTAHGLDESIDVVLGNGSDELIHILCQAFSHIDGGCLICPEPSFAVYRIAAQAVGMKYVGVPLKEADFSLDLVAMQTAIARHQPALVFLASPNNPTANRIDVGNLEALCDCAPGLVVLDEAYYRFAGGSRINALHAIENLVVMQTLSKIGLAGLRVGILFGAAPWIDILDRVRMPYNINALSQAGAVFALDHETEFERQIDAVVLAREKMQVDLATIKGIEAFSSEANFILLRVSEQRGDATHRALRTHGILVKNLSGAHPYLQDCLRVTLGTPAQNQLFIDALTTILTGAG